MVLVSSAKEHIQKRFTSLNQKSKEIYHRIDIRQNNGTYYCKVFNQLATKGRYNILVVCWVPSICELFTKKKIIFFLYRDCSDQNYKQRIQEFLILLHERNRKRGTWNRTISIIWVITAPQQNIWGMFSFTWLNFHFVLSVFSPGLLLLQNIELKPNKMSYVFSRQMLMINKVTHGSK